MKCLVLKLKSVINNDNLPRLVVPTAETKLLMSKYTGTDETLLYFAQKFFDEIGDSKQYIYGMICPCLAINKSEALINFMTGNAFTASGTQEFDASTHMIKFISNASISLSPALNATDCGCINLSGNSLCTNTSNFNGVVGAVSSPKGLLFFKTSGFAKVYSEGKYKYDVTINSQHLGEFKWWSPTGQNTFESLHILTYKKCPEDEFLKIFSAAISFKDEIDKYWQRKSSELK